MNEKLNYTADTAQAAEFRDYLQTEFKMAERSKQDLIIGLFSYRAIKSVRDLGLLPYWDPIEAARHQLIALGVTDPEQQRPVLQRFYLNIEGRD